MKVTESNSNYQNLEQMPLLEVLSNINKEDQTVPMAIEAVLTDIAKLAEVAFNALKNGGRIFYIGAGTSGRLGIVDASECPPTFGVPQGTVIGIIAGGDSAIRKAVEFAEDDFEQGWKDLQAHEINIKDVVIGTAASGSTPYALGAVRKCKEENITTGCIVCNPDSILAEAVDYPITVVVGPEFVTGSTRMKAGTAQKLVLNMISTSVMIQLGKVKGNQMVDMQLSNNKLVDRGVKMLMRETGLDEISASTLLKEKGNVRAAADYYLSHKI